MSTKAMSALILLGTLVLGGVLGMFASGALARHRRESLERLRGPGGFVEHMERVLEPRDETQRAALRPFLEAADLRNREIIRQAEEEMRVALRTMNERVDSLLDADQRARLGDVVERFRPLSPPPGRGAPGGGPSPGRGGGLPGAPPGDGGR